VKNSTDETRTTVTIQPNRKEALFFKKKFISTEVLNAT